jgi:putative ABC transport system ATP-binding protein
MLAELVNVSRIFEKGDQRVVALDDVSFSVERGEFIAVTGPSGCGKSTLMNILGCLDVSSSGRYLLEGEDVSHLSPRELCRIRNRKLGFVFQAFHLLPRSNALDNVMLPLLYSGGRGGESRDLAAAALRTVGLQDRMKHFPSEMSAGEQQRVAIARALVNQPEVLLADEPTGNLDRAASEQVLGLLQQLHSQGKTIIVVTHDPWVADHAKRTVRMVAGRIATA